MYYKNKSFTICDGRSKTHGSEKTIVALFADLRGFSNWFRTAKTSDVATLIQIQYERVIQTIHDSRASFHKMLGDGFVMVWECGGSLTIQAATMFALEAAFTTHKKYYYCTRDLTFEPPQGYGIGISTGKAVLIQPGTFVQEMNEEDFIGYPMNCASRMQELSAAYGTTLCARTMRTIRRDPVKVLHQDFPRGACQILEPTDASLKKADSMKGLSPEDLSGFSHATWPGVAQRLWATDGRL